ncbi:MAG: ferredoxin, partial [Thermoplasmatales archaeon]|nr:ferredoxin [Thermoplasmatales archaeon]
MKKEFKEGTITITVDYDKCKGSGECVTACPVEIFELVDGKAVAKKISECIECCAC